MKNFQQGELFPLLISRTHYCKVTFVFPYFAGFMIAKEFR